MDIPDPSELEAGGDEPDYPDLITVALPRSSWMVVTTLVLRSLTRDVNEINEQSWKENSELRENTRPIILKVLPTLLQAVGPGPKGGPAIQRLQRAVDNLWDKFGEHPSEEHRELAEQCVMNLFERLREMGIDPANMEDVDPEDIEL